MLPFVQLKKNSLHSTKTNSYLGEMLIVSIDPGIISIGLVCVEVSAEYELVSVLDCDAVNITLETHRKGNHVHDLIVAFMKRQHSMFETADIIVIERQPPMSAGMGLEIMFRERFGHKCVFVSPQTLHVQFNLKGFEYNARKERCVALVMHYVETWKHAHVKGADILERKLHHMDRKHDICDAILLLTVWVQRQKKTRVPAASKGATATDFKTFVETFRRRPALVAHDASEESAISFSSA